MNSMRIPSATYILFNYQLLEVLDDFLGNIKRRGGGREEGIAYIDDPLILLNQKIVH